MLDIHSHILPGVDDGARNIETALKIAEESVRQGLTGIVATPHFMEEGYRMTPAELKERVERLQKEIDDKGLQLRVYPGAEVFIYPSLVEDFEKGLVPTINDGRYILLELPLDRFPVYTEEVLYNLKAAGTEIILCHPERYQEIMKNPDIFYNWVKEGIYGQLNTGSILGVFGERVKKTAVLLLKSNTIHLLGSDVHSLDRRKQNFRDGLERIALLKDGLVEELLENNQRVINNEKLLSNDALYNKKKKGFMRKFREYFTKPLFV
ncbi:MAG: hypothetical protein GX175_03140 [Halanaerobiaceae bacterium]|jgi:protein-tyrosine phosphatase|nr:hypothetical protein [Halanaerobiaceae bacterium]